MHATKPVFCVALTRRISISATPRLFQRRRHRNCKPTKLNIKYDNFRDLFKDTLLRFKDRTIKGQSSQHQAGFKRTTSRSRGKRSTTVPRNNHCPWSWFTFECECHKIWCHFSFLCCLFVWKQRRLIILCSEGLCLTIPLSASKAGLSKKPSEWPPRRASKKWPWTQKLW